MNLITNLWPVPKRLRNAPLPYRRYRAACMAGNRNYRRTGSRTLAEAAFTHARNSFHY